MIKRFTTLFLVAIILSMIVMQPLQVANGAAKPGEPQLRVPAVGNNGEAFGCLIGTAVPFYVVSLIGVGGKDDAVKWVELGVIIDPSAIGQLVAIDVGTTVVSETNIDQINEERLDQGFLFLDLLFVAIDLVIATLAISNTVTFGAAQAIFLVAQGLTYGITLAIMSQACTPLAMNSQYATFFVVNTPVNGIPRDTLPDAVFYTKSYDLTVGSVSPFVVGGNVTQEVTGAKGTVISIPNNTSITVTPTQGSSFNGVNQIINDASGHFTTVSGAVFEDTGCTALIEVDIENLEDGRLFDEEAWGDINPHPSTSYPPQYDAILEASVLWENNLKEISKKNSINNGTYPTDRYDSSKTELKVDSGIHSVEYSVKQLTGFRTNEMAHNISVIDSKPPDTSVPIPLGPLQAVLPGGAIIPPDYENTIKNTVMAQDPCIKIDIITKTTNFASIIDVNTGLIPQGLHPVEVISRDSHGNFDSTTVNVVVEDTIPPEIFPVNIIGIKVDPGSSFDAGDLSPPPVFDMATFQPVIICKIGTNDCAGQTLTPNSTTTVTWTVFDAANNNSTLTQDVLVKDFNNTPIAFGANVTAIANIVKIIDLNGTDLDSTDPLKFFLESHPINGSLVQNTTNIFKQRLSLTGTLDDPNDMLIKRSNSHVFVSDKGAKRIIELTARGGLVNIYDTSPNSPDTFVAENQWLTYPENSFRIADFTQEKIFEYVDGTVDSTKTLDFSALNLVKPKSVYQQVEHPGLVFIDENNGATKAVYTNSSGTTLTRTDDVSYSTLNSAFTESSNFGQNAILMPGAFDDKTQYSPLTPSGVVITDWDGKKITINTTPVFNGTDFFTNSTLWQADISSLFVDPAGPNLPPLIAPVAIAMDGNHYSQQKYFSKNSANNARDADRTDDLWDDPSGVDHDPFTNSLVDGGNIKNLFGDNNNGANPFFIDDKTVEFAARNPPQPNDAGVIFGFPGNVTVSNFEVTLLDWFNNYLSYRAQSLQTDNFRADFNEQLQPFNKNDYNAVSKLSLFVWNENSTQWEKLSQVEPTTPYGDKFSETKQVDFWPGVTCQTRGGPPPLDKARCEAAGITVSATTGNRSYDIWIDQTLEIKEETYSLNFPTTTASKFQVRFEPAGVFRSTWVAEINGWPNHETNGSELFHHGPYRITVLDKVTGKLVDIELDGTNPTTTTKIGANQLFGINFVDIQDLDVDSKGNLFVIDDDFISKYDLSGELLNRLNHNELWGVDTIGHQIFIDKDDILHVTMQNSTVFPPVPSGSFPAIEEDGFGGGTFFICLSDEELTQDINENWICVPCLNDDDFYNPLTDTCGTPPALLVKFNSTLAQQGDIRPIFVNDTGKLVYDDDGNVFSQGNLTKFSLGADSVGRLKFNPIATIPHDSSCTDTTPIEISPTEIISPCKVFDSAIDGNNNYFLLTPHSVWKYFNNGTFATKVPQIDLDFGFRLEIDKFDNFYIINGSTSASNATMVKYASNGDLLSFLPTEELYRNFSFNVTSNANLEPPDPNNIRITSGTEPLLPGSSLLYVSEGPPLDRIHLFESNIIADNGTISYISNVTGTDVLTFGVTDLITSSSTTSVNITVTTDRRPPDFDFNCEVLNCTNWPANTQVSFTQDANTELFAEDFAELAGSITDVKEKHKVLYKQRTGSEMPEKMLPVLKKNIVSVLTKNIDSIKNYNTAIKQMHDPKYSIVHPLLLEAKNHTLVQSLDFSIMKKDKNIRTLLADAKTDIMQDSIFSESSYSYIPSPIFIQQTSQTCLPDIVLGADTIEGLHTNGTDYIRALEFIEAVDDHDPNPTITFDIPEFLQIGQNVITITATDASENESTCDWNIFVKDTTPPKLTVDPIAKDVEGVLTPVSIEEFGTPIIDDIDPLATAELVNPPSEFPVGYSEVTWLASDTSGNVATIKQTVLIVDATPPELTSQNDIIIDAINGYANPINYEIPNATDISGIRLIPLPETTISQKMFSADDLSILPFAQITNLEESLVPVVCTPSIGTTFTVGIIQVLCIATDNAFNSQTEGFYVIIHAFDDDGDNIANFVDTIDDVFSDEFNDFEQEGETSGSIITRGNQTLSVVDAFSPDIGIFVSSKMQSLNINDDQDCVDNSQDPPLLLTGIKGDGVEDLCYDENEIIKEGLMELVDEDEIDGLDNDGDKLIDEDPAFVVGTQEAIVTACEESATIILGEGDAANITCGSVTIEVLSGPIEIEFASKIIVATTTLDAGEKLTFDPNTFTFTAGPNTDTIIFVGDEEYHITGGETLQIYQQVVIDIKPGSNDNKINLKSKGVIPVAILSTSEFDATTVDPQSIMLGDSFTPISHKGHIQGVNRNGMNDLLVHFDTQQIQLEAETISVCLIGVPFEGLPIIGCDSVVPIENNSPKQVENAKVDFSSDTKVIINDEPPKGKESNKNK